MFFRSLFFVYKWAKLSIIVFSFNNVHNVWHFIALAFLHFNFDYKNNNKYLKR